MRYPYPLWLVSAGVVAALFCAAWRAEAQQQDCVPRDLVVQRLQDRYGEARRSMGLHDNDGLVEVYSSDTTGTWTIIVTRPDGRSCMLAAGQLWEQDAPAPEPKGEGL